MRKYGPSSNHGTDQSGRTELPHERLNLHLLQRMAAHGQDVELELSWGSNSAPESASVHRYCLIQIRNPSRAGCNCNKPEHGKGDCRQRTKHHGSRRVGWQLDGRCPLDGQQLNRRGPLCRGQFDGQRLAEELPEYSTRSWRLDSQCGRCPAHDSKDNSGSAALNHFRRVG